MSAETVPIYNPLGPGMSAYAAFTTWSGAPAEQPHKTIDRARLLRAYRANAVALSRQISPHAPPAIPDEIVEDGRKSVTRFRARLTQFLRHNKLPADISGIEIVVPAIGLFDVRCKGVQGQPTVYVTSRVFDVVELFARTAAMCARLNGLAAPTLLPYENPLPPYVLLAWASIIGPLPGMTLDDLLARRRKDPEREFRHELFETHASSGRPPADQRGLGHYWLSYYLFQLMMRAVRELAPGQSGSDIYLHVTDAPVDAAGEYAIDSDYLATLVLIFMILHEVAHIVFQHNRPEPAERLSPEFFQSVARVAAENGGSAQDLVGTGQSYEMAADDFAVRVLDSNFRHPMLEAATLWCAAQEGASGSHADWLHHMWESIEAHPTYAARVWWLNGRFSSGARAGRIAQDITRTAEGLSAWPAGLPYPPEHTATIFKALWRIARAETGGATGPPGLFGWVNQLRGRAVF